MSKVTDGSKITSTLAKENGTPSVSRYNQTGTNSMVARSEVSEIVLPVGTRLSDEFEVIGLVGQGGFGIVYLAQDHALQRRVAVKEYMPASLATRGSDSSVALRSERHAETFEAGLRSFINEARLLAQFDHPGLLKVYRFWEANGTAYMAMPYYEGLTLKEWLKRQASPPDEAWLRKMLMPVLDALDLLHKENCFHRDIAPDNLMLLPDGRAVLLDFGAARRVIGDMTQVLTVILKPGYAPVEQYAEMPGIRQGAWTDIYALGCVVYFAITGHTPPPSVGRMMNDTCEPLVRTAAGRYSDAFLSGIDRCIAVRSEQRPQSIAELRELLMPSSLQPAMESTDATVILRPEQAKAALAAAGLTTTPLVLPTPATAAAAAVAHRPMRWMVPLGGVALLAVSAGLWWAVQGEPERQPADPTPRRAAQPEVKQPETSSETVPSRPTPEQAQQGRQVEAIGLSLLASDGSVRFRQNQPISIRVKPDRAAHLYCFMQDEKGVIQRFFPNRFKPDARVGSEGIRLPGKMKFTISANFRGNPEAILCAASPVDLKHQQLIAGGDFKPLGVSSLDDLQASLAQAAGPEISQAKLDLLPL